MNAKFTRKYNSRGVPHVHKIAIVHTNLLFNINHKHFQQNLSLQLEKLDLIFQKRGKDLF